MTMLQTIGYAILSGVIGAGITYFIEAYRAKYPMNILEYGIRRYLKKRSIRGEKINYTRHFEIETEDTDIESLMKMLGCPKNCNLKDFFSNIDLKSSIEFKQISRESDYTLKVALNIRDIEATLSISFMGNLDPEWSAANPGLIECNMELSIEKWEFKDVKDLLSDSKLLYDNIEKQLSNRGLKITYTGSEVTFNIKKTPVLISYLQKIGTNKQISISVPTKSDSMKIYFYEDKCIFINPTTSVDYDSIIKSLVWYA